MSGIAGHKGGEIPERSLGSVKDIGQLVTDIVERWGEKRGSGPPSGSLVLMRVREALDSNMPGMVSVEERGPMQGGARRGVPSWSSWRNNYFRNYFSRGVKQTTIRGRKR
tara:strand:+ start:278 stop:607 length:330 start_codon:yes stop_codon:yes gene_type:complete